ncbi:MAG: polyribonucleotide nucleotidyltransferase [Leptospiraceae bacterium]|nr:polyribonucleotide nucleotidyltransferase [Leptospiraceae bacterium]
MIQRLGVNIGNESIAVETGNWAKQANGSIVYRTGKLVLLATVCAAEDFKEGQDFFPLTCEYTEKMYSVGRIPGGYIKREAKPTESEILMSRIIDRPIRPMFPNGYFCEVQVVVQVLSADKYVSVPGHALNAASLALSVSDIPFSGPIGGARVGRIDGKLVINPSNEEMIKSDLDLIAAGTKECLVMIEGEAKELSYKELLDALKFAHEYIQASVKFQEDFVNQIGIVKKDVKLKQRDDELLKKVRDYAFEKIASANKNTDKLKRAKDIQSINTETLESFVSQMEATDEQQKDIKNSLHELEAEIVREQIFNEGVRADGRQVDEIRPISCEINVLPGAHGSAVFTRGQTQSLGVMTLGTISDNQKYENIEGQKEKIFMLHYNFPPFSVGEVRRMSGPGRREIGHGNLAERALKSVLPKYNDFPYVIRMVSEILESNGSSSMASVCSGSLALLSGGVPIKSPVAGVAMGLITAPNTDKYAILTDIAGLEDHFGDMDFKLAGTRDGITAFQMDLKVGGVGFNILENVFIQAEKGRNYILEEMLKIIPEGSISLSITAPRIVIKYIPKDRIGELIGPGGKTIRSIIEQTKSDINIDDEGKVTICSPDFDSAQMATDMIEGMFAEIEIGKVYEGKVKRITDFGAFVEILPGKEGLCHISKIDHKRVNSVRDILKEGQFIKVKVLAVDRAGRIDLSRKDAI